VAHSDIKGKKIATDKAPAAIGPYSQAVLSGGLIFTAGQIALDPATGKMSEGDITEQTERVLQNLGEILKAAGADWSDVLKTTVYLTDMAVFPKMNDVYARVFGDARPARSTVAVSGLPRGALVEIDAVARVYFPG
jgi:2-iminobutanoate/2-iminopropanoate deaminase